MGQPFRLTPDELPVQLADFDPAFDDGRSKDDTKDDTAKLRARLGELQELLAANATHSVLVLFQGMDTSGKDGAGKGLLECVNPAGVETANFKAPSAEELAHDFLWRVHQRLPRRGNIGVFNRSHYEDVLAVRVLRLAPDKRWRARFGHITAWEEMLADEDVVVLKFFLHISKAEQKERLEARLADPKKNWKWDSGDLRSRAKWDDYMAAYEEMLNRCSTRAAPWHVVPADKKWYRDFVVARTVVRALENLQLDWPKAKEDLSKIVVA